MLLHLGPVEAPLAVGTCLNDCASCLIKLYLQRSQRTNGGRLYGCNLYLVTAVPFYSWSFISSKLIHWGLISIIQRYCRVHHITVQCGFFAHPDPATAPRTRKEAKKMAPCRVRLLCTQQMLSTKCHASVNSNRPGGTS